MADDLLDSIVNMAIASASSPLVATSPIRSESPPAASPPLTDEPLSLAPLVTTFADPETVPADKSPSHSHHVATSSSSSDVHVMTDPGTPSTRPTPSTTTQGIGSRVRGRYKRTVTHSISTPPSSSPKKTKTVAAKKVRPTSSPKSIPPPPPQRSKSSTEKRVRSSSVSPVATKTKKSKTGSASRSHQSPPHVATSSKKQKKSQSSSAARSFGTPFSIKFVDSASRDRWSSYENRPLLPEKTLSLPHFTKVGFIPVLKMLHVYKLSVAFQFHHPTLVREFYCNLRRDQDLSEGYLLSYVRGIPISLSAQEVNNALKWKCKFSGSVFGSGLAELNFDLVATTISGGLLRKWPASSIIQASSLTRRYFLLFRLASRNILPSSNISVLSKDMCRLIYCLGKGLPVNLGHLVLETMLAHAELTATTFALPHPCLVTKALLLQQVKPSKDEVSTACHLLKFTKRSLSGKIDDLVPADDVPHSSTAPATTSVNVDHLKAALSSLEAATRSIDLQISQLQIQKAEFEDQISTIQAQLDEVSSPQSSSF